MLTLQRAERNSLEISGKRNQAILKELTLHEANSVKGDVAEELMQKHDVLNFFTALPDIFI